MNEFEVRTVLIRGLPIFRCSVCGYRGVGSTVRLELETLDVATVGRALSHVSMSHLPVGWACNGSDDIRCPSHVKEKRGPKTTEELLALPIRGGFSQEERIQADGSKAHIPIAPKAQAFYAEPTTVLYGEDNDHVTWVLGRDDQGWYRYKTHT